MDSVRFDSVFFSIFFGFFVGPNKKNWAEGKFCKLAKFKCSTVDRKSEAKSKFKSNTVILLY